MTDFTKLSSVFKRAFVMGIGILLLAGVDPIQTQAQLAKQAAVQVTDKSRRTPATLAQWAQFGLLPSGGRDNVKEHALNVNNVHTLALKFSYSTGDIVYSSPAVVNGMVYFGSNNSKVYALNATTGALAWQYTTLSYIYSSPAVANGVVYIGSNDGTMSALNAKTGALLWRYETRHGGVESSPTVANGAVYFGSVGGNVYALNAKTGAPSCGSTPRRNMCNLRPLWLTGSCTLARKTATFTL
jgi:outer membrane protein assembly factor BamB